MASCSPARIFRKQRREYNDIFHTEVDASLQGQGIAGKLVARTVAEIERRGGKTMEDASCSYAAAWLKRHAEKGVSQ